MKFQITDSLQDQTEINNIATEKTHTKWNPSQKKTAKQHLMKTMTVETTTNNTTDHTIVFVVV